MISLIFRFKSFKYLSIPVYGLQCAIHLSLTTAYFGFIYTLIIPVIDFKYFTILSNLHCDVLAMMSDISPLIPILVCMGLGFLA